MLGITPTYEEIKNFLNEQNLIDKCQFETENEKKVFRIYTTSTGMDLQNIFKGDTCPKFFIEYEPIEDIFTVRCAYFGPEPDMLPISLEEFAKSYPAPHPATTYIDENIVTWIRIAGTNKYNINARADHTIGKLFIGRFPTLTKVS